MKKLIQRGKENVATQVERGKLGKPHGKKKRNPIKEREKKKRGPWEVRPTVYIWGTKGQKTANRSEWRRGGNLHGTVGGDCHVGKKKRLQEGGGKKQKLWGEDGL